VGICIGIASRGIIPSEELRTSGILTRLGFVFV
jgi:hypothetical protein